MFPPFPPCCDAVVVAAEVDAADEDDVEEVDVVVATVVLVEVGALLTATLLCPELNAKGLVVPVSVATTLYMEGLNCGKTVPNVTVPAPLTTVLTDTPFDAVSLSVNGPVPPAIKTLKVTPCPSVIEFDDGVSEFAAGAALTVKVVE